LQLEAKQRREEEAVQRAALREQREIQARLDKWAEYGYVSLNVPLPQRDEETEPKIRDEDEENVDLTFVIGDVARPAQPAKGPVIIGHVVDGMCTIYL
jgi:hypothetical protein